MIKKACDRCHKEYYALHPLNGLGKYILPYFRIYRTVSDPIKTIEINLCYDCVAEFQKWMNEFVGEVNSL